MDVDAYTRSSKVSAASVTTHPTAIFSAGDGKGWAGGQSFAATRVAECVRPSRDLLTDLAQLDRPRKARPLATDGGERLLSPTGGWVGFLSYDLGRYFESLPATAVDDLHLPLFAFDRCTFATIQPVNRSIDEPSRRDARVIQSTFTRNAYLAAVMRAKAYITAGDVFQVNLSQRLMLPQLESSEAIFSRLQAKNGDRFGAHVRFEDFALVSNSPELFFRVEPLADGRRRIINRPIKGTRAFAAGMAHALRDSEKDQAELAMIVDLQRNDLGRICEIGTVRVTQPREIEAHPTVYHGVATIEGMLRRDVTFVDILRAVFPCGSVTGCPKIRAMEIIEELEPVRRGPYCGAIGWIGDDGSMEFSVAIRTMIIKDGLVHVPVGGGIVADSDPVSEYHETLVKAEAMFSALGLAAPAESIGE